MDFGETKFWADRASKNAFQTPASNVINEINNLQEPGNHFDSLNRKSSTLHSTLNPLICITFLTFRPGTSYASIFSAIGAGQKLCNVRHADSSIYTWDIPEHFGEVSESQRSILETIAKHRRHKKYGDIPNGNPIPLDEIASIMGCPTLSRLDFDKLLKLGYVKEMDGGYDLKGAMFCSGLFKRPLWDAPSPTVLTNFHNPRYFLHPEANRPFSLRECARLQGFPDDFLITSGQDVVGLEDGYRLVGNAVPPPVGRILAAAVAESFARMTVEDRNAA